MEPIEQNDPAWDELIFNERMAAFYIADALCFTHKEIEAEEALRAIAKTVTDARFRKELIDHADGLLERAAQQ